jgi:hypothetical protein
MEETTINTGVELIAAERKRQIEQEGWMPEHDDEHEEGELAFAGAAYAHFVGMTLIAGVELGAHWIPEMWPFDREWWKPSPDPIRNLVKAGALIAAEIDRLQRKC